MFEKHFCAIQSIYKLWLNCDTMLNAVICRHALQKCHACRRKKILSGPVLLHPQTQPTTSPDSSCCTPRLNPPHPQTQPTTSPDSTHCTPESNLLHPQTQTAASADSKHSTPRLKPQHPRTQTTAPPDSNHSTPRLNTSAPGQLNLSCNP